MLCAPTQGDFRASRCSTWLGVQEARGVGSDVAPSRVIIGFLTSAATCYTTGHGVGVGFLRAEVLLWLQRAGAAAASSPDAATGVLQPLCALARNVRSMHYHPVLVRMLTDPIW